MTAEKGSAFLLKVGDGATPPTFATVAGLRTTQLSINGEMVAITHKGSGGWRELLTRIARAPVTAAATPGRVIGAPDAPVGTTVVHVFELPSIDDTPLSTPRLAIAAAGTGAGWRSAALQVSFDGGTRWAPVGSTAARAILGSVATAPGAAPSTLVDQRNAIEVVLAHTGMALFDADDAALDGGANLAIVGDELLQFGRAEPIMPGRWRLSRLWRGRRGTEWAAGLAMAGDRFVLLDPASLVSIAPSAGAIGGIASVLASGAGDGDTPATATAVLHGGSIAPPSPVHLTAMAEIDGALDVSWVRRSRAGWHWVDRLDAALVEETERYAISVDGTSIDPTTAPGVTLPAGAWNAGDSIDVRQFGTQAPSRAAQLTLS